jgi:hypothetical protein
VLFLKHSNPTQGSKLPNFETACDSIEFHEAGPNVVTLFDGKNKDSSVSDLSSTRGINHCSYDVVNPIIVCDNLDHQFGQEGRGVFHATIKNGMSFLTPVPFRFEDCEAWRNGAECLDDDVELVRLDDALNQLH